MEDGDQRLVAKRVRWIGGPPRIDEERQPMRARKMNDRAPVKGGVRGGSASPLRKRDPPR